MISGESRLEDADEDSIPVRCLDKFALFIPSTRQYVSPLHLLSQDAPADIIGTGNVYSYTDDGDDWRAGSSTRVKLSEVLECSVHWISDIEGVLSVDW